MGIQSIKDQLLEQLAIEVDLMPGTKIEGVKYIFTIEARINHVTEGTGTLQVHHVLD